MKITDFFTGRVSYNHSEKTIEWPQMLINDYQYLDIDIGSKFNNEEDIGNWIAEAINEKLERENGNK